MLITKQGEAVRHRFIISVFIFGLMAFSAEDAKPKGYHLCGEAKASAVLSGNRMTLEGGSKLVLDGVLAPMIPREGQEFKQWPLASWARSKVETIVENQTLTLFCGGRDFDRYGERVALVRLESGAWLHNLMLADGLARVDLTSQNITFAKTLYEMEDAARKSRVGLHDHPAYGVLDATKPDDIRVGRFHVLVGAVYSVYTAKTKSYINFGEDFREDFTLELSPKVTRQFTKAGIDIQSLKGKRIEVRGWVDARGGPRIILTHPSQIRILD